LQEAPVNVKEEPECLAEADRMETEEEETSEESSSLRAEINCADKEIKGNVGGGKDNGLETKNESKSYVPSEETTLKQCLEEGTVARKSDLPLSDQDRDGLCDKLSVPGRRSSTKINDVKCPEEDILIQNDVCSQTAGMVPGVKKAVMCDEEAMVCQNVTEKFVKVTNGIEKRKRGRPRKPRVRENLETDKGKNNGTCSMSQLSKIDLNNELESLTQSISSKEIFNRKQYKLARRHKEKTVNGLEGMVRKQRAQATQILSDVLCKPGEMNFEEQRRNSEGLAQQTTKEENESRDTVIESRPPEGKADSSIEIQKLCSETKSTLSNMVAANRIEASNVLIPPVES
jgi:polyhydroxyalkanoate synthesis regulator phasin